MMDPFASDRLLFSNYLDFVRAHRGYVVEDAVGATIFSDAPNAASWTPYTANPASLPPACRVVRLVSWSGDNWTPSLSGLGFAPAEAMSFMELPRDAVCPGETGVAIKVRPVRDDAGALQFAAVQSAGFLRKTDATFSYWDSHFRETALTNYRQPTQTFLLAEMEGIIGGVAVMIVSPSVTALYAVATRPEFQRRGFGSALLGHVVRDSRARESRVALQSLCGSYAEGLYERLGFETRFRSQIWRMPATDRGSDTLEASS